MIDIDQSKWPDAETVNGWSGPRLASAIRHIQDNEHFNAHMRQLLHVSFKVAAKHGDRYTDLLKANETIVGGEVTKNIYERHLRPLFVGDQAGA